MAQLVKNLPAMLETCLPATLETWVQSLGWEDPWRRESLPTPVFWPGEFHGLYSPWGRKESDATERLSLQLTQWPLPKGYQKHICLKVLFMSFLENFHFLKSM